MQIDYALLQSSISQINGMRDKLEKLYIEIREEQKNCKNKSEEKDVMLKIEQIQNLNCTEKRPMQTI